MIFVNERKVFVCLFFWKGEWEILEKYWLKQLSEAALPLHNHPLWKYVNGNPAWFRKCGSDNEGLTTMGRTEQIISNGRYFKNKIILKYASGEQSTLCSLKWRSVKKEFLNLLTSLAVISLPAPKTFPLDTLSIYKKGSSR